MTWKPCDFDRKQYLADAAFYESTAVGIECITEEMSEFNDEADELALELAYSRYRIARLERFIRNGVEYGHIRVPDSPDPARDLIDEIMSM